MPEVPDSIACHVEATSPPTGEVAPRPVTTMRVEGISVVPFLAVVEEGRWEGLATGTGVVPAPVTKGVSPGSAR